MSEQQGPAAVVLGEALAARPPQVPEQTRPEPVRVRGPAVGERHAHFSVLLPSDASRGSADGPTVARTGEPAQ